MAKGDDDINMKELRAHLYTNVQWGRYHQPWYKMFIEYLQQDFSVDVKDYDLDGKTFGGSIELQTNVGSFGKNSPLSDVDLVIENLENGEFFVLSVSKYFSSQIVHYLRSDKCLGILSAHFSRRYIVDHLKGNRLLHRLDDANPWIFPFYKEFDVDYYRNLRDSTESLNDKLYFKGGGWGGSDPYRSVIRHLYEEGYLDPTSIPFENYLTQLSQQSIAVSHYMDLDRFTSSNRFPGELCYRDIEMMSIGVPYIRVEYKSELHGAFIPNYHYIVIPREDAGAAYAESGDLGVSKLIIDKYHEIENDKDFLKFISKNQRRWYDETMRWPKSAEFVINKFKIENWL